MRIVDLADSTDPELVAEFYDAVLRPSFTVDELPEDSGWLVASLSDGSGEIIAAVVVDDEGGLLSGAVGEPFPDCGIVLLGYMATRPGNRSRGLGSLVIESIVKPWISSTKCDYVVGEVMDPRLHREDLSADDRVRFYARHGARVADVPFFQPRVDPHSARVYGELLTVVAAREDMTKARLSSARLRCFVEQYFHMAEGSKALDDPEVRWLLSHLTGEKDISLVPIEQYESVPVRLPSEPRNAR